MSRKIAKYLKKLLFFKPENSKNIFFSKIEEETNAILLVLPIKDISLRPELSSPTPLQISGG